MALGKRDPSKKPLLFGESYENAIDKEMDRNLMIENDPGWIPGYSEQVRANEISAIDPTQRNFTTAREFKTSSGVQLRDHYLQTFGAEAKPLPMRLKWVRVSGMDGTENKNVRTDLAVYKRDGYQFASKELLEKHGYTVPPVAEVGADGLIRRGDVALMYVDAERAKLIDLRAARERSEREQPALQPGIEIVEHQRESNYVLPSQ